MATYAELYALQGDDALRQKVAVATVIAAEAILKEDPPVAARVEWAKSVTTYPIGERARDILMLILAANKSAAVATIQSASDATIQTAVDAVVDGLIAAGS